MLGNNVLFIGRDCLQMPDVHCVWFIIHCCLSLVCSVWGKSLFDFVIRLIFFQQQQINTPYGETTPEPVPSTSTSLGLQTVQSKTSSSAPMAARVLSNIKEDDVDVQLAKMDGKVERKRDEKL